LVPTTMSHPSGNEYPNAPQALDLRAAIRPIRRWKWLIVLVVVVAAGGTYGLTSRLAKHYVASARVYVTVTDPAAGIDSSQPTAPPTSQDMQDLAELFTAQWVTAAVAKQLGLVPGSAAAGSVSVTPLEGPNSTITSFLIVTATAGSAGRAAQLANTYVSVFLATRRSAQSVEATSDANATHHELDSLPDTPANAAQRQALLTQESQLRTLALNPAAGAEQTNTAVAPTAPSSPKPARDAVLAGVVGLLLGLGLAFGLEFFDRRLLRVYSVESTYGLPVLSVLPHVRDPNATRDGHPVVPPQFVEPMRSLRVSIGLASGETRRRSLLVASGIPGEGKSTIVRDLALVHAESGDSVLVIDADLRQPSVGRMLGVHAPAADGAQTQPGLAQVLRGETKLEFAIVPVLRFGEARPSANGGGPSRAPKHSQRADPGWFSLKRRPPGAPTAQHPRDPNADGSIDLLNYGERIANPLGLLASEAMKQVLAASSASYRCV